jgi:hypothetical protein
MSATPVQDGSTAAVHPRAMKALALLAALLVAGAADAAAPSAADPVGTVASLFQKYDVVGIPEVHRYAECHVFLRQLVSDPRITGAIDDIVVEFGNGRYQDVADRYVMGGDVPAAELEKVWQNTTMLLVWDSPLYRQFFETVRNVNATLPRAHRIRVLLGDPDIDWATATTREEYEKHADRDYYFAGVVDREVFAKKHKALLIAGSMHMLNARPSEEPVRDLRRSLADLIRRRHPGRVFAFWQSTTRLSTPAAKLPVVVIAAGTPWGDRPFADFAPHGVMVQKMVDGKKEWVPLTDTDWSVVKKMADGLLDYGPVMNEVPAPASAYKDPARVTELRRRAAIMQQVYGMSFDEELAEALRCSP